MARHNDIGRKGEDLCADYLVAHGYAIAERNWRFERFEIDIIAMNVEYMAFVEVKTRYGNLSGDPLEAINRRKISNMIASANAYAEMFDIRQKIRFDLCAVQITDDGHTLEYIEDAFFP